MKRKLHHVSSRNNAYQHLEVIKRNRAKRTRFGEVAVEGVLPINLCISNQIPVKQIFFSEYDNLSQWAKDVIEGQPEAGLFSVSSDLMSEISDKEAESELIIVAQQPQYDIDRMSLDRVIVLDRPSNPGNFGAIVRTCDAFSMDAVLISGHGIDPYDPKSITASRGTIFSLPIVKLPSNKELAAILDNRKQRSDFVVYGSSARTGVDLRTAERSDHFALIIGNETTGMTAYLKELADIILRIPMHGDATSLNAACAASILVYKLSSE